MIVIFFRAFVRFLLYCCIEQKKAINQKYFKSNVSINLKHLHTYRHYKPSYKATSSDFFAVEALRSVQIGNTPEITKQFWHSVAFLAQINWPHSRPLPTQVNTSLKSAEEHPSFEWDATPRSKCSNVRDPPLKPLAIVIVLYFNFEWITANGRRNEF